jgi:hypothetical protein
VAGRSTRSLDGIVSLNETLGKWCKQRAPTTAEGVRVTAPRSYETLESGLHSIALHVARQYAVGEMAIPRNAIAVMEFSFTDGA